MNTALHIAALGGNSEVVKLLIAHGADINLQAKVNQLILLLIDTTILRKWQLGNIFAKALSEYGFIGLVKEI